MKEIASDEAEREEAFKAWRRRTAKIDPDAAVALDGFTDGYANRGTRSMHIGWKAGWGAARATHMPSQQHAESMEAAESRPWIASPPPAAAQADAVDVGVIELARRFHEYYEAMAPRYGYETRTETRTFDQYTPNGRLMIAVIRRLRAALATPTESAAITSETGNPEAAQADSSEARAEGYRIYKDGSEWCAVGPGFVDLQTSPSGFGMTPGDALEALMRAFGEKWAKQTLYTKPTDAGIPAVGDYSLKHFDGPDEHNNPGAITEEAVTQAVRKWFPDRAYQAPFFAAELLGKPMAATAKPQADAGVSREPLTKDQIEEEIYAKSRRFIPDDAMAVIVELVNRGISPAPKEGD